VNVTVFGATGAIGTLTVRDLIADGHHVTAYARDPGKVPAEWAGTVEVVIGELRDAGAVGTAVAGAQAVINAMGPSMDRKATGMPLVEGARNIVAGMDAHGVRRYIGHGTPSAVDPRDGTSWAVRFGTVVAKTVFARAYREMVKMTAVITRSDLDWTIVRFLAPTDGPARGIRPAGFVGDGARMRVTRADIARFTADQLGDDRWVRAMPHISN
jgi:uncharacterized protein YbjT (DUF2867 family)